MRTFLASCAVGAGLLTGGGCSMLGADRGPGFDIHFSLPPYVKTAAVVQQTEGPMVISGLAAMPAAGQLRGSVVAEPAPVTAQLAPQRPDCCEDIRAALGRIESKMPSPPTAESLRMPRGN